MYGSGLIVQEDPLRGDGNRCVCVRMIFVLGSNAMADPVAVCSIQNAAGQHRDFILTVEDTLLRDSSTLAHPRG